MESSLVMEEKRSIEARKGLGRYEDSRHNRSIPDEGPRRTPFKELIGLQVPYTAEISKAEHLISRTEHVAPSAENMREARRILLEVRLDVAAPQMCTNFVKYFDLNTWRTIEAKQKLSGSEQSETLDDLETEFSRLLDLVPFNSLNSGLFSGVKISPSEEFVYLSKAIRSLDLALASSEPKDVYSLAFDAETALSRAIRT